MHTSALLSTIQREPLGTLQLPAVLLTKECSRNAKPGTAGGSPVMQESWQHNTLQSLAPHGSVLKPGEASQTLFGAQLLTCYRRLPLATTPAQAPAAASHRMLLPGGGLPDAHLACS